MPRIAPDIFDQLVWPLTEQSGNYRNVGQTAPNDPSTDLIITNTMTRNGASVFSTNALLVPGTSNYPSGSSASRNYISGANNILINVPLTLSFWVYLRSYTTNNNTTFVGKEYRNPSLSGNSWIAPFHAINITTLTSNGGGDWAANVAISSSTQVSFTVTDFPIPLGVWSHMGMTHDGSNLRAYLNGCQMITYPGGNQATSVAASPISYTDGTNGFGPWRIGAITSTGSANKEEPNINIADVRIASVARPLSYFKKFYATGVLPTQAGRSVGTRYFKLRAYDLSCTPPRYVVWVDTQISLANAPAFPCSGPFSSPEVLETWFQ
jgi:hypothetical protein